MVERRTIDFTLPGLLSPYLNGAFASLHKVPQLIAPQSQVRTLSGVKAPVRVWKRA